MTDLRAVVLLTLHVFLFCVATRNALWKQRELVALLRNPQEDPERVALGVVMETDAGSLPGEFSLSCLSFSASIKQHHGVMMSHCWLLLKSPIKKNCLIFLVPF